MGGKGHTSSTDSMPSLALPCMSSSMEIYVGASDVGKIMIDVAR